MTSQYSHKQSSLVGKSTSDQGRLSDGPAGPATTFWSVNEQKLFIALGVHARIIALQPRLVLQVVVYMACASVVVYTSTMLNVQCVWRLWTVIVTLWLPVNVLIKAPL